MLAAAAAALGAVVLVGAVATTIPVDPTRALLEPSAPGVFVRHGDGPDTQALEATVLGRGDAVHTDAVGRAVITYADGTTLVLEPGARLVLDAARSTFDFLALVRQTAGRLWHQLARGFTAAARYEGSAGALAAVVRAGSTVEVVIAPDGTAQIVTVSGAVSVLPSGAPSSAGATPKLLPEPLKPGAIAVDAREPVAARPPLVAVPPAFAPLVVVVQPPQPAHSSDRGGTNAGSSSTGKSSGDPSFGTSTTKSGDANSTTAGGTSGDTKAHSLAKDSSAKTGDAKPAARESANH